MQRNYRITLNLISYGIKYRFYSLFLTFVVSVCVSVLFAMLRFEEQRLM